MLPSTKNPTKNLLASRTLPGSWINRSSSVVSPLPVLLIRPDETVAAPSGLLVLGLPSPGFAVLTPGYVLCAPPGRFGVSAMEEQSRTELWFFVPLRGAFWGVSVPESLVRQSLFLIR